VTAEPGHYNYKFFVDGVTWKLSPKEPQVVDSSNNLNNSVRFGCRMSRARARPKPQPTAVPLAAYRARRAPQVTVAEAVTFRWRKQWGGSEVFVTGERPRAGVDLFRLNDSCRPRAASEACGGRFVGREAAAHSYKTCLPVTSSACACNVPKCCAFV
jgi:hypothetical protein